MCDTYLRRGETAAVVQVSAADSSAASQWACCAAAALLCLKSTGRPPHPLSIPMQAVFVGGHTAFKWSFRALQALICLFCSVRSAYLCVPSTMTFLASLQGVLKSVFKRGREPEQPSPVDVVNSKRAKTAAGAFAARKDVPASPEEQDFTFSMQPDHTAAGQRGGAAAGARGSGAAGAAACALTTPAPTAAAPQDATPELDLGLHFNAAAFVTPGYPQQQQQHPAAAWAGTGGAFTRTARGEATTGGEQQQQQRGAPQQTPGFTPFAAKMEVRWRLLLLIDGTR